MGALWVLNLDAEEELENPAGYAPSAKIATFVETQTPRAIRLLAPGDVLWDPNRSPLQRGLVGKAWCPTPRALRLLACAGALPVPAPPLAVLQRVNHRRFCHELGSVLPQSAFFGSGREALERLEGSTERGPWLLKRPFGFAGRGQRRITGRPSQADRRWLLAQRSRAGLVIEPFVDILREFAIHGFIDQDGALTLGRICEQRCDHSGAWQDGIVSCTLEPALRTRLLGEAERVADALHVAGYFGPFGIDAYEYADAQGQRQLNPRSEVNARYTMGYSTGMSAPQLAAR